MVETLPLTITCALDTRDKLIADLLTQERVLEGSYIQIDIEDHAIVTNGAIISSPGTATVYLNEAKARELFNWLGAILTTGKL